MHQLHQQQETEQVKGTPGEHRQMDTSGHGKYLSEQGAGWRSHCRCHCIVTVIVVALSLSLLSHCCCHIVVVVVLLLLSRHCHCCYARTLGTFLSALWRRDCLLYGYGIVRMRVAIPGTLRVSSCLYAYL